MQYQNRPAFTCNGIKSSFNISKSPFDGCKAVSGIYKYFILALLLSEGPLRSASLDVLCQDWRIRVLGDVGGWGTYRGTKEARVTMKHTVQGQVSPALQVRSVCMLDLYSKMPLC